MHKEQLPYCFGRIHK